MENTYILSIRYKTEMKITVWLSGEDKETSLYQQIKKTKQLLNGFVMNS